MTITNRSTTLMFSFAWPQAHGEMLKVRTTLYSITNNNTRNVDSSEEKRQALFTIKSVKQILIHKLIHNKVLRKLELIFDDRDGVMHE